MGVLSENDKNLNKFVNVSTKYLLLRQGWQKFTFQGIKNKIFFCLVFTQHETVQYNMPVLFRTVSGVLLGQASEPIESDERSADSG